MMGLARQELTARAVFVDAPPLDVFALVSNHARLPEWVPGVLRVEVDNSRAQVPGGAGAVRTLIPRIGRRGHERIIRVDRAALRIDYSATDESLVGLCSDHRASIACSAEGTGTLVSFSVQAAPGRDRLRSWLGRWMFRAAVAISLRRLARYFAGKAPQAP